MDRSSASAPAGHAPAARQLPWLGLLAVALAALCAVVGFLVWQTTAPGRSLSSLGEAERRVLHARTMDDLRTLCRPAPPEALRAHCRELAELVTPLPECDAECQALVRPLLAPAPTR